MTLPQWAYGLKPDQLAELQAVYQALEFYATETNWNYDQIRPDDYTGSGGKRAREALNRGSDK
jgi:hypothetical protein